MVEILNSCLGVLIGANAIMNSFNSGILNLPTWLVKFQILTVFSWIIVSALYTIFIVIMPDHFDMFWKNIKSTSGKAKEVDS